jgi:hypothetical protein
MFVAMLPGSIYATDAITAGPVKDTTERQVVCCASNARCATSAVRRESDEPRRAGKPNFALPRPGANLPRQVLSLVAVFRELGEQGLLRASAAEIITISLTEGYRSELVCFRLKGAA